MTSSRHLAATTLFALVLLFQSIPGLGAGFGPGAAESETTVATSKPQVETDSPVTLRIYGGEVKVDPTGEGKWELAGDGIGIPAGGSIRTSDDARAEAIYRDGTVLRIQPSSEMSFLLDQIDLKKGDVWVRVTKRGSKFEIVTRTAVAGVRGTIFEVDVNPVNYETRVLVFEGKVEVQEALRRRGELTRGKSLVLEKGFEAAVTTRSFPEKPTSFAYAAKLRRWTDQESWPKKEKLKEGDRIPATNKGTGVMQNNQRGGNSGEKPLLGPDGKPVQGSERGPGPGKGPGEGNGERPGGVMIEGKIGFPPGGNRDGMKPGEPILGGPTSNPRTCGPGGLIPGPGQDGSFKDPRDIKDPRMLPGQGGGMPDPREMRNPRLLPGQGDPRDMPDPRLLPGQGGDPFRPGEPKPDTEGGTSTRDPRQCDFAPTRDPRQCGDSGSGSLITRDPRACGIPEAKPPVIIELIKDR